MIKFLRPHPQQEQKSHNNESAFITSLLNLVKIESDSPPKGLPLLFIHTTPLDHIYLYQSILSANLTWRRDLWFIDLPGHGKSPPLPKNANLMTICDAIKATVETQRLNEYVVYGHGFGGMIAQCLVATDNHCQGGIFANTAADARYRKQMAWRIRDKMPTTLRSVMDQYRGKLDDKSLRARFTLGLAAYFPEVDHERAKQIMDAAQSIGTEAYTIIGHRIIPHFDMRDKLLVVKKTCLVVVGEKDIIPKENGLLILNALSDGHLMEFDNYGHFPMLENPEEYWRKIKEWLDTYHAPQQ